jgi:hypothetical protein
MRANPIARPHPSRRAYARSNSRSFFGVRAPQDEDGHRVLQSSPYKQPFSFPRRISAPGVLHLCFTHPESRGGRSAEKRSGARRDTRGACHSASKTRVNALMSRHALTGPIPVFSCFSPDSESSIPGLTISSTHTSSFPRRVFAPGVLQLWLHSPRVEGWAERRETFGCSGTR